MHLKKLNFFAMCVCCKHTLHKLVRFQPVSYSTQFNFEIIFAHNQTCKTLLGEKSCTMTSFGGFFS